MKKLDKLLDCFIELGIPGFETVVKLHGKEIYRRRYGDAPEGGQYNIYSCSKPITVVAAMQLWEKGKFSLDDKLSDYMPEFKEMYVSECGVLRPAIGDIHIRDLFTMSAGLTYNLGSANLMKAREDTNGRCPTRETMRYLAKDALIADPGKRYNYSLCHDVIAALTEVVSGKRFGEYVKENIFDVLGMEHSTYLASDSTVAELAPQYIYNSADKTYKNIGNACSYRIGSEYESGGAGCITTVDDYMLFLESLRTGDVIIKNSTLALMTTNQLDERRLRDYGNTFGYGYGLGMRCYLSDPDVTDFGWGGAAGAYLCADKKYDFTVFHVQHVLNSPNQPMRNLMSFYIREELSKNI